MRYLMPFRPSPGHWFLLHPFQTYRGSPRSMFTAFVFSSLFLVTYITNHALHGDMHFRAGLNSLLLFPLLISHIGLSVVALR